MTVDKKVKVLAIDNEKDILYTLQAIGNTMGWQVFTETNSLLTTKRIAAHKPDLVLIDYHMPNQDGLTTVKQIRQQDKQMPIIVLTVDESQEIADKFLDAGANDFATKPIKVPDLAARINIHIQLLQRQREAQASAMVTKGINEATLQLIYNYCRSVDGWFSIEDVAENAGLAYQTTVRYLQHLISRKELAVVSDYGKVGRPRNKYRYIALDKEEKSRN